MGISRLKQLCSNLQTWTRCENKINILYKSSFLPLQNRLQLNFEKSTNLIELFLLGNVEETLSWKQSKLKRSVEVFYGQNCCGQKHSNKLSKRKILVMFLSAACRLIKPPDSLTHMEETKSNLTAQMGRFDWVLHSYFKLTVTHFGNSTRRIKRRRQQVESFFY